MYSIKHIKMPRTIEEAIGFLQNEPETEIISGGTDVLIKIREGKMNNCSLVSISQIPELKGIEIDNDKNIIIKSATVFSHITNNDIIIKNLNVLGEAADQVGGPQIRNMGTIGGNVCNGVTSADTASTLCALNAIMLLRGSDGNREVSINEWYIGPGKTVRKHDEILTAIKITKDNYEGYKGFYIKYGKRNAMEIATLGCSIVLKLSEDKRLLEDIRIAYGVASPTPMRCFSTENMLKNKPVSKELFNIINDNILNEVNPRSSWRASKEFRQQIAKEMAKRALTEAIKSAGGDISA